MSRFPLSRASLATAACLVLLLTGCTKRAEETTTTGSDTTQPAPQPTGGAPDTGRMAGGTMPVVPATPPDHIEVQHILIGFQGSIPNKTITRTRDEAKTLANEILARARRGEDFDQLVQKHTDDQYPGIYKLANTGITPGQDEYAREGMVKGFSDAAFGLSPGNVGIADYHPQASPYGWHIIKRLK